MKKSSVYIKELAAIVASFVMLSLIHAPFDMTFLVPIAYIPIILAFKNTQHRKRFTFFAVLASLVYWMFNIYWLINIIAIGWIGASLIMALFQLIFLLGLNVAIKRKYSLWISLPIIITGIEYFYGVLFGGFNWHLLGYSLYRHLELIQIADITGVAGISFAIAMVNGLICDIVNKKNIATLKLPITITLTIVLTIVCYGKYRIATEPENFETGPLIAIVQSNVPSTVKEDKFEGKNILKGLLTLSNEALATGSELVVWPETIVSSAINADFLMYSRNESEPWQYHNALLDFTNDTTYLVAGATALKVGKVDGINKVTNQYNSAFMYSPKKNEPPIRYDKIHLVPFGEYIPPQNIPWIKNFFLSFSPYDYDYTLTPGEELTRFGVELEGKQWNFATMICYEDTDAELNRKLIYSKEKGKVDWLLNISNDGWYIWYKDGKVSPSIELAQRTAISVFRAVETRITLMRSVNTGISCKIDPMGRIIDGFDAGTLPQKAFDRQAVEGWFTDRPDIDPRITFFTIYGDIFSKLNAIALILMIITILKKQSR